MAHAIASRVFIVLLAAAGLLLPIHSPAEEARIPAADLKADFAVLKQAYEAIHPGLYRYNSRAEMDAHFEALRQQWDHDLTLPEAYLTLSVFLARVKCGHTYANFFNQAAAVAEPLLKKPGRVPFCFRWLDRRMIVTRDLSGQKQIAPGDEVLSLNGVAVGEILDRLLTVARADGSNDAKRIVGMEVHGDSRYEAFDVFLPLFYPLAGEAAQVRLRPAAGGPEITRSLPWQSYAERLAAIQTSTGDAGDDQPLWTLTFPNPQTACLRMPTWATFNSKWDWKKYLDGVFADLAARKTPNLVFDLRDNEGGADQGEYLLGKLVRRDLALDEFKRLVRYRKVPDDLSPYLDTWDKSFKDWGEAAAPASGGFFVLHRWDDEPGSNLVKPSPEHYAGRVFVLIDANNSSATFQFAQVIQRTKMGTLVGQPTGGNQRGINGGAFFFLRLPHSKLEADLPIVGTYPAREMPDAGLTPDVPVVPTVEDIAHGVDSEMAAVARLIGEGR